MSTKRPRRASRSDTPHRRDRELLDAATRVFYRRGYSDATVQDVADELGILKGSLYHYIDNKEDLLFRIFMELHEEGFTALRGVAESAELTATQRVELFVRLQIEFNLDHLMRIAVYHSDLDRLGPERHAEIFALRRVHENYLTDLIIAARDEDGADVGPDPFVTSKLAHGSMIWVYRWYRPTGRLGREAFTETTAAFVLRAIFGDREHGVASADPTPIAEANQAKKTA